MENQCKCVWLGISGFNIFLYISSRSGGRGGVSSSPSRSVICSFIRSCSSPNWFLGLGGPSRISAMAWSPTQIARHVGKCISIAVVQTRSMDDGKVQPASQLSIRVLEILGESGGGMTSMGEETWQCVCMWMRECVMHVSVYVYIMWLWICVHVCA